MATTQKMFVEHGGGLLARWMCGNDKSVHFAPKFNA